MTQFQEQMKKTAAKMRQYLDDNPKEKEELAAATRAMYKSWLVREGYIGAGSGDDKVTSI